MLSRGPTLMLASEDHVLLTDAVYIEILFAAVQRLLEHAHWDGLMCLL